MKKRPYAAVSKASRREGFAGGGKAGRPTSRRGPGLRTNSNISGSAKPLPVAIIKEIGNQMVHGILMPINTAASRTVRKAQLPFAADLWSLGL